MKLTAAGAVGFVAVGALVWYLYDEVTGQVSSLGAAIQNALNGVSGAPAEALQAVQQGVDTAITAGGDAADELYNVATNPGIIFGSGEGSVLSNLGIGAGQTATSNGTLVPPTTYGEGPGDE